MEGSNGVPRKNEHHLALLPTEILLIIISYLDNDLDDSQLILDPRNVCQRRFTTLRDVASLSLTCWRLRNLSAATLFRRISLCWKSLDSFIVNYALAEKQPPFLKHIKAIDLFPADSWGEWHQGPKLSQVLDLCPNIRTLCLELSGSSHWLRYVKGSTKLSTIISVSHTSFSGRELSTSTAQSYFDIGHLVQFSSLRFLSLQGFNVSNSVSKLEDGEDDSRPPHETPVTVLSHLSMLDCVWDWPWDVSDFGQMTELTVAYSDVCRSFTCKCYSTFIFVILCSLTTDSERLQQFAKCPPATIERLRLYMLERSPLSRKAWLPLSNHKCYNLSYLSLKGFEFPGIAFFERLPSSLRRLELEIAVLKKNSKSLSLESKAPLWSKLSNLSIAVEYVIFDDSCAKTIDRQYEQWTTSRLLTVAGA